MERHLGRYQIIAGVDDWREVVFTGTNDEYVGECVNQSFWTTGNIEDDKFKNSGMFSGDGRLELRKISDKYGRGIVKKGTEAYEWLTDCEDDTIMVEWDSDEQDDNGEMCVRYAFLDAGTEINDKLWSNADNWAESWITQDDIAEWED